MQGNCKNIYRIARDNAKMTREEASLLLNISSSMLKIYEQELKEDKIPTKPCDQIVLKMIEIYGLDYKFGYKHLRYGSDIGEMLIPESIFEEVHLETKVLKLIKKLKDVIKVKDDLIDIAYDGKISEGETEAWKKVQGKLKKLGKVCLSLSLLKPIHLNKRSDKNAS